MEPIPLLEFDKSKGIIEPGHQGIVPLPEHCVMPMYGSLIEKLKQENRLSRIHSIGTSLFPMDVYRLDFQGKPVTVAHPGIGAPFAGAMLEELIANGCRKFVACGSAGVLKPELKRGAVIIPRSAVRDEGTSYHYCPPSRMIGIEPAVVKTLESVLIRHKVDYEIGKTWTTDAFFRETAKKIKQRKSEGCITVEMECSRPDCCRPLPERYFRTVPGSWRRYQRYRMGPANFRE